MHRALKNGPETNLLKRIFKRIFLLKKDPAIIQEQLDHKKRVRDHEADITCRAYLNSRRSLLPRVGASSLPKLAIITEIKFWKQARGNQNRIYELADYLRNHFHLHIIFLGKINKADISHIQDSELEPFIYFGSDFTAPYKKFILKGQVMDRVKSHDYSNQVEAALRRMDINCVLIEYIKCLKNTSLLYSHDISIALDLHDIMFLREKSLEEAGIKNAENSITKDDEIHIYNNVDLVIAIQKKEHDIIRKCIHNKNNVILCEHTAELTPLSKLHKNAANIGFVGSLADHNIHGVVWFIESILPRILEQCPAAKFHIFGSISKSKAMIVYSTHPRIKFHGEYDRPEKPYLMMDIAICPVTVGSGLKIKCIEALRYNIPIVMTPLAAEGIEDCGGIIASNPEEFSTAVITLIKDPAIYANTQKEQYDYTHSKLRKDIVYGPLTHSLNQMIKNRMEAKKTKSEKALIPHPLAVLGFYGNNLSTEIIKNFIFKFPPIYISYLLPLGEILDEIESHGCQEIWILNPYGSEIKLNLYNQLLESGHSVKCIDRGALPDSWFFDPNGFNFASTSYADKHWNRVLSKIEAENVNQYILTLRNSHQTLEAQGKRLQAEAIRVKYKLGNKKILFIPLQRPNDSVIRHFCNPIGSFGAFLECVNEVKGKLGPEWIVIAKKHPLEKTHPAINAIYVDDDEHIHSLLEIADAVMLINSGVGCLSMIFGKPTVICGGAFYEIPGVNFRSSNANEIHEYIESNQSVDAEKVRRFIHYLRYEFYLFGKAKGYIRNLPDNSTINATPHIIFYEFGPFLKKSSTPIMTPQVFASSPP